jgi:uncharacterized membrane protein YdbT with pleckstrin-like domain
MPPETTPPTIQTPPPETPGPILDTTAKSMEEIDHDERLISIIHRHFFGIFIIYVQTFAALALGIGLIYFLLPNFVDRSETEVYRVIGLVAGAIIVLMTIILVIATIIYYSSRLILTDKNITQVLQIGIFNRKVSQLAVTNVEDVTATKQGVFSTFLNYGVLNIETAGEQINFIFNYCPRPDFYARQILEAREQARGGARR